MKHHSAVKLAPEMGAEVMRLLGSFVDVEQLQNAGTGIVAGQAVASAVQDLYCGGRGGVYNDVDWFDIGTPEEIEAYSDARGTRRIGTVAHMSSVVHFGPYGLITLDTLTRYKVLSSRREGMLNRVAVNPLTDGVSHHVLASFDFNCVQVGVDLESGSLVWTPEFEEFLSTRQLELASLHTPWHSAIRYFKKLAELQDVYGDDARIMETAIAAHRVYVELGRQKATEQRWLFGPKAAEEYRQYEGELSRWFELECKPATSKAMPDVYGLAPKVEVSEKLVATLKPWTGAPRLAATVSRAVLTKHKAAVSARLERILKLPQLMYYWADQRAGRSQPLTELAAEQHSIADLGKVNRMLTEHGRLAYNFLRVGLAGSVVLTRVLDEYVQKHGRFVIGLVEQGQFWNEGPTDIETAVAQLKAGLDERIPQELAARQVQLTKQLLPKGYQHGDVCVRSLITRGELVDEGDALHHCVGGYGEAVARGAVILSLRSGPRTRQWSTAELAIDERTGRFRVCQHRGPCNETASARNEIALQALLESRMLEKARLGRSLGALPAEVVAAIFRVRAELRGVCRNAYWKGHNLRWHVRRLLESAKGNRLQDFEDDCIPF